MSLTKLSSSSKLGIVQSKSRLLGQIIEKPCERSKGHILLIKVKLAQNDALDKILYVWNWVMLGQKVSQYIIDKTLWTI